MIVSIESPTLNFYFSGLFRSVILMSGSLFASWARVRDPLNYALQLGKYFNCTIPNDLTNDHNQVIGRRKTRGKGGGSEERERERFGFDRDLNRIHLCANFCSLMTNRIKRRERES